jgi:hypothetical protein
VISAGSFSLGLGALSLAGVALAVRTRLFVRRAVRTRARVVKSRDSTVSNHDSSSQSSTAQYLLVEFTDLHKRNRRVELSQGIGGEMARGIVGGDGKVPILYDPRDPKIVRLDSFWTLHIVAIFCLAPGLLFAVVLLAVWILTIARR